MSASPAPTLFGTAEFSIAELCAARLDGELYPLAEMFCPVDLPEMPAVRAAALLALMPQHAFVERLSAVWLHGAVTAPPRRAQFALPVHSGVHPREPLCFSLRQVVVTASELTLVAGCRVSTPARTLSDLMLDEGLAEADACAAADALSELSGLGPDDARAALRARYKVPGAARAERRIVRWEARRSAGG